ncbi:MAG: hypothetical protein QXL58_04960 [Candidatus Hadarchaeales archaeon]
MLQGSRLLGQELHEEERSELRVLRSVLRIDGKFDGGVIVLYYEEGSQLDRVLGP